MASSGQKRIVGVENHHPHHPPLESWACGRTEQHRSAIPCDTHCENRPILHSCQVTAMTITTRSHFRKTTNKNTFAKPRMVGTPFMEPQYQPTFLEHSMGAFNDIMVLQRNMYIYICDSVSVVT